jgi:hypothetical protein
LLRRYVTKFDLHLKQLKIAIRQSNLQKFTFHASAPH